MSASNEHDPPIMTVEISARERTLLLMSLWNDHLQSERQHRKPAASTDDEFKWMIMSEWTADLVRKLGGDPEAPTFGIEIT